MSLNNLSPIFFFGFSFIVSSKSLVYPSASTLDFCCCWDFLLFGWFGVFVCFVLTHCFFRVLMSVFVLLDTWGKMMLNLECSGPGVLTLILRVFRHVGGHHLLRKTEALLAPPCIHKQACTSSLQFSMVSVCTHTDMNVHPHKHTENGYIK